MTKKMINFGCIYTIGILVAGLTTVGATERRISEKYITAVSELNGTYLATDKSGNQAELHLQGDRLDIQLPAISVDGVNCEFKVGAMTDAYEMFFKTNWTFVFDLDAGACSNKIIGRKLSVNVIKNWDFGKSTLLSYSIAKSKRKTGSIKSGGRRTLTTSLSGEFKRAN